MNPETKFQAFYRSLLAGVLVILALPFIGLWAIASGIEKTWTRIKPKG